VSNTASRTTQIERRCPEAIDSLRQRLRRRIISTPLPSSY